MYTLDANIFVRDASPHDPDHQICHELLARLYHHNVRIVVPTLILAEIAGALSRSYRDPIRARLEISLLRELAHINLVNLSEELAQTAAELAADCALRGADAVYIAVAQHHSCALVTLDREPRERAALYIRTLTPADALAELDAQF